MLREDEPSRFDYLFEPLDDDDAAADTDDDGQPTGDRSGTDRRRPGATIISLAAFIIATVAGVWGVITLLLPRPEPVDNLNTPSDPTPLSTVQVSVPTPAVLAPPPPAVTPRRVAPPARTVYITPRPQQPPPRPAAPTQGREPEVGVTRAPISVQPEPRTPFPNENSGDSNQEDGGILGGLPGVGGLPGPL
jgi:hypothetical protein